MRLFTKNLWYIIRYLAKQSLAFRGHNEEIDSNNRGNFIELCEIWLAKYDSSFKLKFQNYFNSTSSDIQN